MISVKKEKMLKFIQYVHMQQQNFIALIMIEFEGKWPLPYNPEY